MQKIKGKSLMIRIEGRTIALATNCQLSMNANIEETKTKDNAVGPAGEFESLSWTMSSNNIVGMNEGLDNLQVTHLELSRKMIAGEKLELEFTPVAEPNGSIPVEDWGSKEDTTGVIGVYTGVALIESLSLDAPAEGDAKLDVSFRGVGPLTITPAKDSSPSPNPTAE